jgi:hypothetical protein
MVPESLTNDEQEKYEGLLTQCECKDAVDQNWVKALAVMDCQPNFIKYSGMYS